MAEGAAIRRDPSRDFRVASLNAPDNPVLSTGDLALDFQPAGRFLVGHTLGECLQIEGVYLGVVESDDTRAVRNTTPNALGGQGNLFSPFGGFGAVPLQGWDYNNFAQIRYTSSLRNAELNLRRQLPMPPERLAASVLVGVRYVGIPEEFDYLTQSDVPAPGGATNSIRVTTDNQMIGPQIGGLFQFYYENRWWLNFEIKGGLLSNRAEQSTSFQQIDSQGVTHDHFGSRQENHTAFLGELDLTAVYRWSPHFATRLGYQAIWMTDLALASNNLNTDINILLDGPAGLDHRGNTVYHGPHAGIELSW
jgi:hypothetical protein